MERIRLTLIFLLLAGTARAVDTVNNPTPAQVLTAINATANGGTVRIMPANASLTWTTGLSFTKGITLDLNGATITRNMPTVTTSLVTATAVSGFTTRITNGRMTGGSNQTTSNFNGRYIRPNAADGANVRIDNITFDQNTGIMIETYLTAGQILIDHCTFDIFGQASEVIHGKAWGSQTNEAGWLNDITPGGLNGVLYVEDCTFNKRFTGATGSVHIVATFYGARAVIRNNIINGGADIDVHGNQWVGGRWTEIYNNTWNVDSNLSRAMQIRAGSGVIFGNVLNNLAGAAGGRNIFLWEENVTGNIFGFAVDPYPALYQVGQGKQPAAQTTGASPDPLYIWGNTNLPVGIDGASGSWIVAGRDYILATKTGWPAAAAVYPHPLQGVVSTAPVLSSISPTTRIAGSGAFTLTLTGNSFVSGAVVRWNGGSRTTSFVSATSLTAAITAADVANAGSASVTVQNPNGETSSAQTFTITPVIVPTGTYYVSNSGVDSASQPGTLAAPFATINYAISRMVSGDEIIVRGGTYDLGVGQYITSPSGTNGNPCAIRAYQGETPMLTGNNPTNQTVLAFTGVSWWEIEGLNITGTNFAIMVRGSSSNLRFLNNNLHDSVGQLVHIKENSSFITFEGNTMANGGSLGTQNGEAFYIGTHGTGGTDFTNNVTIRNNTISNLKHEAVDLKHNTYSCVIEGNTMTNIITGSGSTFGKWAIIANPSDAGRPNPNHIIRNNTISGVGDGILTQAEASGAFELETGCQVYNNVIYNTDPDGDGIHSWGVEFTAGDGHPKYFWNNTYTGPTSTAIHTRSGTLSVGNNIGPAASVATTNLPYSAAYFVAPGATPPDFHLVAGSAPIDAGTTPPFTIGTDKDGVSRTASPPPDIGAYESTAAITVVDTPAFSIPGGSFFSAQTVAITCATSGATIRYTIDGTDPTASSPVYVTPLNIASRTTLKAKAFKSGSTDSAIASALYEIGDWTTGATWKNVVVPPQTGIITWTFRASVNVAIANAVIGLSPNPSTGVTDLEPILFFNDFNRIQARNDTTYAAVNTFPYTPNTVYEFVVTLDIAANTYSATVAQVGQTPVVIATNYLFRGGNGTATELDNLGMTATGTGASVSVSQMSFAGIPPTAPTLTSASVGTNGTTLTTTYDIPVRYGTGGSGGWTINASGGAATLTPGANPTTFTISRVIAAGETGTISYVQPGNGVESSATGNVDLGPSLISFANQSTVDQTAPIPNPSTFSSPPNATSSFEIAMTATTATDATAVQYYFDETSANPGGTDSGWQSSPNYTDTGLSPGVQYTYRVLARDAALNQTTPSDSVDVTTPIIAGARLITPTKQIGAGFFAP